MENGRHMTQKAKAVHPMKVCGDCYWYERGVMTLNTCGCKDSDHYAHLISGYDHPGCEWFREKKGSRH